MYISEKAMAPHSSTLAWKIPWMEKPGGLQSMGSLRDDTTERLHFHFLLSCIREGNGNPLQCSCLENPRDGESGGLPSMGLHRVRHDWSDLAAAAYVCVCVCVCVCIYICICIYIYIYNNLFIHSFIIGYLGCFSVFPIVKWCCNEHGGAVACFLLLLLVFNILLKYSWFTILC